MARHLAARLLRWVFPLLGLTLVTAAAASIYISIYIENRGSSRISPAARVAPAPVAIVFGAGLWARQAPSPMLAERLDAAIALYKAGKVRKILVSGDDSDRSHDETRAMRRYALSKGVPTTDVVGDYAGLSTYDTCYRARTIFGVDRAILVTQHFHLPRALFLANALGMDATGVAADEVHHRPYPLRELAARPWALVLVLFHPEPRFLGESEPIAPPP